VLFTRVQLTFNQQKISTQTYTPIDERENRP
jgi:hypothetical protein